MLSNMKTTSGFIIAVLLSSIPLSHSARPDHGADFQAELKKQAAKNGDGSQGGGASGGGIPGFFGPGNGGFGIPGFSNGWGNGAGGGGYGAGYGGPNGGYAKGGIVRPTVTCTERGPCYKKKLICPAKCFSSYSKSGKNYGSGGGGGGCTMDCKKCIAYC